LNIFTRDEMKPLDFECPKTIQGLIAEYSSLVTALIDEGQDLCAAQEEAGQRLSDKYNEEILGVLPWFEDFNY
jgi:hypothetical protein